jgi:hypothetical protein
MARDEYETEQIVTDIIVESSIEIWHDHLSGSELAAEVFVLALKQRIAAEIIDGTMLGRGHKPGSRIFRDARLRPLFEGGYESILGEVLGDADIAHNPREAGDEPGRLDPPDGVNRTMRIGSHSYRSHHASLGRRKPGSAFARRALIGHAFAGHSTQTARRELGFYLATVLCCSCTH